MSKNQPNILDLAKEEKTVATDSTGYSAKPSTMRKLHKTPYKVNVKKRRKAKITKPKRRP